MNVEGGRTPQVPQSSIDLKPYKSFAKDLELILRVLYAGFFKLDPYGLEYDGVMLALEGMISYLKIGRECNV